MREKSSVLALMVGALTVVMMTACGSKPKDEQVSVIDENHFDQLASTTDAPGNASAVVEVLGGDAAAQGSLAQQAGMPMDAAADGTATIAVATQASATAIQPAIPSAAVTVKPTATYEEKVQAALKNAGYYTGAVDGKIGSKTREAIKAFQSASGLKADGVVGPGTWEKLKKFLSHS